MQLAASPTVLPPCDQIVERVSVWRKAEDDPTDGAPKNNSVTHRLPQLTKRSRIIPRQHPGLMNHLTMRTYREHNS